MKRIFFVCLLFAFLHISFAEQARFPLLEENFKEFSEAAQKGDAVAQNALAICYRYGLGTEENNEEALKWCFAAAKQGNFPFWILQLNEDNKEDCQKYGKELFKVYTDNAQKGDAKAQLCLGLCYKNGIGVEENKDEAAKWFFTAAKQENADALAELCFNKEENQKLLKELFDYYIELASAGSTYAKILSLICFDMSAEENLKEAFNLLLSLAEQGNPIVQRNVALFYQWGLGVEENKEEAFKWYLKAAQEGDITSFSIVASHYKSGEGVEKNDDEAFKWSLKSAKNYDARGGLTGIDIALIADCYERGMGVEKNLEKAFQWRLVGAKQGQLLMLYLVAQAYESGKGVEKNEKEAFKYYSKAAAKDSADSFFSLAQCYEYGRGVERNMDEAIKCYIKSAENGNISAQVLLARYYEEGEKKNLKEAKKYYDMASKQIADKIEFLEEPKIMP